MRVLLLIDVAGVPIVHVARVDGQPMQSDEKAEQRQRVERNYLRFLAHVVAEVKRACQEGALVFILEDAALRGRTHPAILYALGDRPHLCGRKGLHNGAPVVLDGLAMLDHAPEAIDVAGALTDVCVRETVQGLREVLGRERVRVLPGCCFDEEWDDAVHGA